MKITAEVGFFPWSFLTYPPWSVPGGPNGVFPNNGALPILLTNDPADWGTRPTMTRYMESKWDCCCAPGWPTTVDHNWDDDKTGIDEIVK